MFNADFKGAINATIAVETHEAYKAKGQHAFGFVKIASPEEVSEETNDLINI